MLEIVKQNSIDLKIALKRGTVDVADLASVTSARFVMRRRGETALVADITETPPATKLLINDPATGSMRVKLDSNDTNIDLGAYDLSLQITFSATQIEEFFIKEQIKIVKSGLTLPPTPPGDLSLVALLETELSALTEVELSALVEV